MSEGHDFCPPGGQSWDDMQGGDEASGKNKGLLGSRQLVFELRGSFGGKLWRESEQNRLWFRSDRWLFMIFEMTCPGKQEWIFPLICGDIQLVLWSALLLLPFILHVVYVPPPKTCTGVFSWRTEGWYVVRRGAQSSEPIPEMMLMDLCFECGWFQALQRQGSRVSTDKVMCRGHGVQEQPPLFYEMGMISRWCHLLGADDLRV